MAEPPGGADSPGRPGGTPERPAIFFRDAAEWRARLELHHSTAPDLWMGLRKKHVPDRGLVWEDAVREALCFGWIDSQVQRLDADAVRQRWTPRRVGSVWSDVNVAMAHQLIAAGRMAPAGLAAFEARRADRQGIYAYEQADSGGWTPEHDAALAESPAASAFWQHATDRYRRVARHWVTSAKQQATRNRRLAQLVACCTGGEFIPTQRYGTPPAWLARAASAASTAAGTGGGADRPSSGQGPSQT